MLSSVLATLSVTSVVSTAICLFLVTAIYRLTLHPLAKYPGPLLARLTDWYSVYYCVRGDNHTHLYHLHNKYGKFVRHGPNRLSISDARAVKEIYGSYGYEAKLLKADYYTVVGHHFGELNLVSEDHPLKHARKRRLIAQGLTSTAVKSMETHFVKNSNLLCDMIDTANASREGEPEAINIDEYSNILTFDVMADSIFGRSLNLLTSTANRWILNVLPDAVHFLHVMGHMPILLLLDYLPFKSQMAKDMDAFQNLSVKMAQKRIQRTDEQATGMPRDVFSYLLGAKDEEEGEDNTDSGFDLTNEQLIAEAGMLMIAGSDTTAMALTATLYHLAREPALQKRLRAEIESLNPDTKSGYSIGELWSCKYLRACLDEAMRLTPPVGGALPRKVLAPGIQVAGEYIPEGIDVAVPIYTMHRDPSIYPDPLSYNPSRWIEDANQNVSSQDVKLAEDAFMGFSIGPRGCLGQHFAYAEMNVTVAKLLTTYDLELDSRGYAAKTASSAVTKTEISIPTLDKFVSHPIEGPFIKFRKRAELGSTRVQ